MTSEGFICHKIHPAGFDMPVVLDVNTDRVKGLIEYQPPLRDRMGRLAYALPGGGIFVEL